jgi:hypothetical protein
MTAQNLSATSPHRPDTGVTNPGQILDTQRAERAGRLLAIEVSSNGVSSDNGVASDKNEGDVDARLPQSLSGVFDQAFDLYKQHARTLILIAALLYFPTQIALHAAYNTWLLPIQLHLETPTGSSDIDAVLQMFGGGLLIGMPEYGLPGICALIVLAIMSGPLCVAVSDIYFGRTPTIAESYRRALRALPRLVCGWLFGGLAVFGVSVACIIGVLLVVFCLSTLLALGQLGAAVAANISSVLLVVGMVTSYLICTAVVARFLLFLTPLAVLEGLPLGAVWGRNQQMVGRIRFRHTWAAASALPLVVFGLQYLILLSSYSTLDALQLSPLLEFLLVAACTAAIVLFFQPYVMVFVTLLYYDYRVRGEGFDLVLLSSARYRAETIAIENAVPPAPSSPTSLAAALSGIAQEEQTQQVERTQVERTQLVEPTQEKRRPQ